MKFSTEIEKYQENDQARDTHNEDKDSKVNIDLHMPKVDLRVYFIGDKINKKDMIVIICRLHYLI